MLLSILGLFFAQAAALLPWVGIRHAFQAYRDYVAGSKGLMSDLQIFCRKDAGVRSVDANDIEAVRRRPNVKAVLPMEVAEAKASDGSTVLVIQLNPEEERDFGVFWVAKGRHLESGDRNRIAISQSYANARHLSTGDSIPLDWGDGPTSFEIVGILAQRGFYVDDATETTGIAYVTRADAAFRGRVFALEVQFGLGNDQAVRSLMKDLRVSLGSRYMFNERNTSLIHPGFDELFRWTHRIGTFVGIILAGIVILVPVNIAVHVGRQEHLLMNVWTSLGLSRWWSHVIFALEALYEVLVATVLTGGALLVLKFVSDWLVHDVVLSHASDSPLWGTSLLLSLLISWLLLFAGRCAGAASVSQIRRRIKSNGAVSWVEWGSLVAGAGLLAASVLLVRVGWGRISTDTGLWIYAILLVLSIASLSKGLGPIVCAGLCGLLHRVRMPGLLDRTRLAYSLVCSGQLTLAASFRVSSLVFLTAMSLLAAVEGMDRAASQMARNMVIVTPTLGKSNEVHQDLRARSDVHGVFPVVMAGATLNARYPVMAVGLPRELIGSGVLSINRSLSDSRTADGLRDWCFLSSSFALEDIGIGDTVHVASSQGRFEVEVLGFFAPTTFTLGNVLVDREVLLRHSSGPATELFVVSFDDALTREKVTKELRSETSIFGVFDLTADLNRIMKEVGPVIRNVTLWLSVAQLLILVFGSLAASQNAVLQMGLQQYLGFFREMGVSFARLGYDAFCGILLVLVAGLALGRLCGELFAQISYREMTRHLMVNISWQGSGFRYWVHLILLSLMLSLVAVMIALWRQKKQLT